MGVLCLHSWSSVDAGRRRCSWCRRDQELVSGRWRLVRERLDSDQSSDRRGRITKLMEELGITTFVTIHRDPDDSSMNYSEAGDSFWIVGALQLTLDRWRREMGNVGGEDDSC